MLLERSDLQNMTHHAASPNDTILFVPHYKGSTETLLLLAEYMRNKVRIEPLFLIYFDDNQQVIKQLEEKSINYVLHKPSSVAAIPLLGKLIKPLFDLPYARRLCREHGAVRGLICVTESNVIEYALIAVLNKMNLPTVVLQWAQSVPREYYAHLRMRDQSLPDRCFSGLKNLMRHSTDRVLGIKRPVSYGSGGAKYFAVMGEYYRELFESEGVASDKIVVTGHPEHDVLYQLRQKQTDLDYIDRQCELFGLDSSVPVWIVAREAIRHFELLDEERDRSDMRAIFDILSSCRKNEQVILKLHPRDDAAFYRFIEEEYPFVRIIHECDLYSLISLCELYLAQISSTMMWALALGKIVITYDFNNQPYWHYFRDKAGLIRVDSPAALRDVMHTFYIDKTRLADTVDHVADNHYMCIDGKAKERLCSLLLNGIS